MRAVLYLCCAVPACAFVAWTSVHTDEITFTLTVILVLAAALGVGFPKHVIATILLIGLPVCVMETCAGYGLMRAPFPVRPGISWAALFALIPAALGAIGGACLKAGAQVVLR